MQFQGESTSFYLIGRFPGVKPGQHGCKSQGAGHLAHYGNILKPFGYDRYFWLVSPASKLKRYTSGIIHLSGKCPYLNVCFWQCLWFFCICTTYVNRLVGTNGKVAKVYISQPADIYILSQIQSLIKSILHFLHLQAKALSFENKEYDKCSGALI